MKNVLKDNEKIRLFLVQFKNTDFLFSISLGFFMSFYTLNNSEMLLSHVKGLVLFGIGFGIWKLIIQLRNNQNINFCYFLKENIRKIFPLALVSGVIIFRFCIGHDTRLLIALFIMICGIDVQAEKMISVMFYVKLACFIMIMLFDGFQHINSAALQGGIIILLFICMRENKMRKVDYLIIFIFYVGLAFYTKSGSVIIGLGIAVLSLFLIRLKVIKKIYKSGFMMGIYPFCLLMNLWGALGVNESQIPCIGSILPNFINQMHMKIIRWIDAATSSRLTLANSSLQKFGISILGGTVDYSEIWTGVYFNLDSGMIWLLQGWGLLTAITFMIMTIVLMRYLIGTSRYHYIIAATVIALWATQEDMLVCVGTNFLMALMGQALYYNVKRGKNEV